MADDLKRAIGRRLTKSGTRYTQDEPYHPITPTTIDKSKLPMAKMAQAVRTAEAMKARGGK